MQAALDALVNAVRSEAKSGRGADVFEDLRVAILNAVVACVRLPPESDLGCVVRLLEFAQHQGATIASLNYDLAVERAGAMAGIPVSTGIEHWNVNGQLDWPQGSVRLLKLHGSMNWRADIGDYSPGAVPWRQIRQVGEDAFVERHQPPGLVFGERGKLDADGPYLQLLLEWERELRRCDSLFVIGYSFRDDHINTLIARWFHPRRETAVTRRLIVLDPAPNFDRRSILKQAHLATEMAEEFGRVQYVRQPADVGLTEASDRATRPWSEFPSYLGSITARTSMLRVRDGFGYDSVGATSADDAADRI